MNFDDDRPDNLVSVLDASGLPILRSWQDGNPESTASMVLHTETTAELALYHTALFWPDLIEHEGGVFLRDGFRVETYRSWRDQGLDPAAIEQVGNRRHIGHMFPGDWVGYRNCVHLASVLRQTWSARLRSSFPHLTFSVDMLCDDENEEVVLTFWRNRAQRA